jgi:hypothetical protein
MYINKGMRQQDIAGELTRQGFQVSKGAVSRTIKSHTKTLKEIKEKQEWAKTLIAATDKTPWLDIADAGLRISAMKLLEEVSNIENFGEMNEGDKVALLTKVSRAIGLAANVELNFERGRKQGLLDAGKKLEEAAETLGLSDRTKAFIKAELLGANKK